MKFKTKKMAMVFLLALTLTASILALQQCEDGIDNDLDGNIDYPADSGCDSSTDRTESRVLAYAHGCLADGDKLKDVFGHINYECDNDLCMVCVSVTEAGNWTTLPSKCSGLIQCGYNNANGTGGVSADSQAPAFDLLSPLDDLIFTTRKVLVEFNLDEKANVYYLDLINGRGRWTRVCSNCNAGYPAYSKLRSFNEGMNNLTFKAVDKNGNTNYTDAIFFIDSKDPKISKTYPKKKSFADGNFEVQFKEENPVELVLNYGSYNYEFDIENDCTFGKGDKYYCNAYVDLSAYNGQSIEYSFILTDIAGNIDESKPLLIYVDTTAPEINNPYDFYSIDEKYVYFNLNITESNFDEAFYTYIDSRGRLRDTTLCSKLKNGMCEKKKSFNEGNYSLTLVVVDEAGNSLGIPLDFEITY